MWFRASGFAHDGGQGQDIHPLQRNFHSNKIICDNIRYHENPHAKKSRLDRYPSESCAQWTYSAWLLERIGSPNKLMLSTCNGVELIPLQHLIHPFKIPARSVTCIPTLRREHGMLDQIPGCQSALLRYVEAHEHIAGFNTDSQICVASPKGDFHTANRQAPFAEPRISFCFAAFGLEIRGFYSSVAERQS